jgi:hypothetical protein
MRKTLMLSLFWRLLSFLAPREGPAVLDLGLQESISTRQRRKRSEIDAHLVLQHRLTDLETVSKSPTKDRVNFEMSGGELVEAAML